MLDKFMNVGILATLMLLFMFALGFICGILYFDFKTKKGKK